MKKREKIMKKQKKNLENEKKLWKQKKLEKMKKIVKNEKNCENPIWEMSFRQLVCEKCLLGFVCFFGKKYTWEMFIRGNTFEVMKVNP